MKSSEKAYTLYILKCSDDTYYTGIAVDIEKRLNEHNTSEKGAKYTRSRRPVILMYSETCTDKSTALKRELAIKRMKRAQKEALWTCG
ncbi:MAG: endonuclease [Sulfuricurvum sp. RIFOXYD2_FULL_44_160]|uniref:GIY-YIG nuclease family protein n=1 Tax=unclassified Sulfuricurvum TaxID=2632390 RepID=UPI0008B54001|nr:MULTISPECIES: GIY-YIG nuclease family protein [unclassified Sulfuricurvum]OHD93609.1 MAG: endonuclease [Sulfuricurvum sp. RIFOXYD12_FULL_44_77]OHD97812.1 MAG: endonuclease [Sulfuricurvum sp. RIFOXYD2_FULL_44_160]